MDERQERIGRNEALYRSINDRLGDLNAAFAMVTETFAVACECGDVACVEQITIAVDDYERVRADPALFLVRPGHAAGDVEEAVEAHDAYDVIRKRAGEPEELAEELDERSP